MSNIKRRDKKINFKKTWTKINKIQFFCTLINTNTCFSFRNTNISTFCVGIILFKNNNICKFYNHVGYYILNGPRISSTILSSVITFLFPFHNLQLTDYGSIEIQNLINDTLHIVIRRKFRRFDEEDYIISI